jgi:hypothetical protein
VTSSLVTGAAVVIALVAALALCFGFIARRERQKTKGASKLEAEESAAAEMGRRNASIATLRDAVQAAAAGRCIDFVPGTTELALGSNELIKGAWREPSASPRQQQLVATTRRR